MIYLYLGQNDLCLPATAAAIHLGLVEKQTKPKAKELRKLPLFRAVTKDDDGKLHFVGEDKKGNKVYITSVKGHPDVFVRGVHSLLGVYRLSLREIVVTPCVPENPQIGLLCTMMASLGLQDAAAELGSRVARNRFSELAAVTFR